MSLQPGEELLISTPHRCFHNHLNTRILKPCTDPSRPDDVDTLVKRLRQAISDHEFDRAANDLRDLVEIDESDAPYELAVIIGDEATRDEVIESWKSIDGRRAELRDRQGFTIPFLRSAIMSKYLRLQRQGRSLNQIADKVDKDLRLSLCLAVLESRARSATGRGLKCAFCICDVMCMKFPDAAELINGGLDYIREGQSPWQSEDVGQIGKERMKDAFRQWRRGHGGVTYRPAAPFPEDAYDWDSESELVLDGQDAWGLLESLKERPSF